MGVIKVSKVLLLAVFVFYLFISWVLNYVFNGDWLLMLLLGVILIAFGLYVKKYYRRWRDG